MERVGQYVWKPELGVNKPQETYAVQKKKIAKANKVRQIKANIQVHPVTLEIWVKTVVVTPT